MIRSQTFLKTIPTSDICLPFLLSYKKQILKYFQSSKIKEKFKKVKDERGEFSVKQFVALIDLSMTIVVD